MYIIFSCPWVTHFNGLHEYRKDEKNQTCLINIIYQSRTCLYFKRTFFNEKLSLHFCTYLVIPDDSLIFVHISKSCNVSITYQIFYYAQNTLSKQHISISGNACRFLYNYLYKLLFRCTVSGCY